MATAACSRPAYAYDLYDADFNPARAEHVPEGRDPRVEDVSDYADCAYDPPIFGSRETAERIVDAHAALQAANDKNGEGQNNRWHLVEKPLSEIVLDAADASASPAEPSP